MKNISISEKLPQLDKLISQKKFDKAVQLAQELLQQYPDDPFIYAGLSICHSELGDNKKALSVLQKARKLFPKDHDILFYLAETLNNTGAYVQAEKAYRQSIAVTPKDARYELSSSYNGLGVSLWEQHKRQEALEMWKIAIKEDPRNTVARENLKQCTNAYNEPAAPSHVFDDLYHFQKIQTDRYFRSHGRTRFKSKEEAERVIGAIMAAWNTHVAPKGKEIDAMTPAEKTELFESVKVEFK